MQTETVNYNFMQLYILKQIQVDILSINNRFSCIKYHLLSKNRLILSASKRCSVSLCRTHVFPEYYNQSLHSSYKPQHTRIWTFINISTHWNHNTHACRYQHGSDTTWTEHWAHMLCFHVQQKCDARKELPGAQPLLGSHGHLHVPAE